MNKQIALAYGVAGLAVAIAFVTVVWTTVGFSEPAAPVAEVAPLEAVPAAALADFPSQRNAAEVVYVDETGNPVDPRVALASTRGGHDDDDRWEHEEEEDDDDDDDDHHRHGDRDDD